MSRAELPWCKWQVVPRYDPNTVQECGNRARWRAADGLVVCGRHLRHVARPVTAIGGAP